LSEETEELDDDDGVKTITYLTTNMLAPANQSINEITVDTLDLEQIKKHLDDYYKVSARHKNHFSIFDPKESLIPFKNK
jgi:hypothetical protein